MILLKGVILALNVSIVYRGKYFTALHKFFRSGHLPPV